METKTYIWLGITIGGLVGGWLGSLLDGGNFFGIWGIVIGTIGSFAGVWAGYILGNQ